MIEERDRSPYGGSNENTSISAAGNESFLSRGEDEKEEKKMREHCACRDALRDSNFSINFNLITKILRKLNLLRSRINLNIFYLSYVSSLYYFIFRCI